MRFVIGLMLAVFTLAACEPVAPQLDADQTPRPSTPPQSAQVSEATAQALPNSPAEENAAEPEEASGEVLPPPDPPMLAQQRAACLREGGQLSPRGAGIYSCVMRTSDAGQRCDAASDCQGACLARSGTCSPLTPLFGCQEVFTLEGRRETVCID